jgi:N6-adenosine-specific RNA methylase IME4
MYLYETGIIDPPWPYERASSNEKLTGYVSQDGNEQYPTLSVEDMKTLPIGEVIGGYLFVWTTSPFIPGSLELIKSWGFEYITSMAWYKNTGIGVGYWLRGDHELVLIAKRTGYKSIRSGERSLFQTPRTRHSEKPDHIHKLVERCFPGPYIEIFGRRSRPGWKVLGNQSPEDGKDIRISLAEEILIRSCAEGLLI